jgi:hypothetical protein
VRVRGGEEAELSYAPEADLRDTVAGLRSWNTTPVEDGAAEIQLARGRWGVWAVALSDEHPLRSQVRTVEMSGGRVELTLDLEPPATLVIEPAGRPLELCVLTPDGLLAAEWARLSLRDLPQRVRLLPGAYDLLVREEDREDRVQRVVLPARGVTVRVE